MTELVPCQSEGLFESTCSTKLKKSKFRFNWTINDFSSYWDTGGVKIVSSTFSDGTGAGLQWRLAVQITNSVDFMDDNDILLDDDGSIIGTLYLSLLLELVSNNISNFKASCKFGILDVNCKKVNQHNISHVFGVRKILSIDEFITRYELFERKDELFPDDALTILCEITFVAFTENNLNEQKNLGNALLENLEFTDVTICADGTEFKAHKAILAARSNVFRAMFQHDMIESRTNHVDIPEVNCNILKEMLHFIYTDQFSASHGVTDLIYLWKVADKYQLERLKLKCKKRLSAKLTNENAARCYFVANEINAEDLIDDYNKIVHHF